MVEEKRRTGFFDIILNIIIILLTILVIYWFIQLVFGSSPELSEFNSALIILLASFLFKIYREIGEIKIGIKHSFIKTKEDMSIIKEDTKLIKTKLKI